MCFCQTSANWCGDVAWHIHRYSWAIKEYCNHSNIDISVMCLISKMMIIDQLPDRKADHARQSNRRLDLRKCWLIQRNDNWVILQLAASKTHRPRAFFVPWLLFNCSINSNGFDQDTNSIDLLVYFFIYCVCFIYFY